jgi:hypothetical protein
MCIDRSRTRLSVACCVAAIFLASCATRPINPPLTQIDKTSGYRGNVVIPKRPNNELSTLFILAFPAAARGPLR